MSWEPLGSIPPRELQEDLLQLHWAAQVLAGAGRALAPPRDDDSHTASVWRDGALCSARMPGGQRICLDLGEATLESLPSGDRFPLDGRRLDAALAWAGSELGRAFPLPEYEMPPHPVAEGRPFRFPRPGPLREIPRWYGNLAAVLGELRSGAPDASPLRCWPHHFDLAFLTPLEPTGTDPEAARSIGMGLSPGDANIREPYLYVLPWPRPECSELPGLSAGGTWWTDGFLSAILTGSDLLAGEPGAQEERTRCFLENARDAATRLLQP